MGEGLDQPTASRWRDRLPLVHPQSAIGKKWRTPALGQAARQCGLRGRRCPYIQKVWNLTEVVLACDFFCDARQHVLDELAAHPMGGRFRIAALQPDGAETRVREDGVDDGHVSVIEPSRG